MEWMLLPLKRYAQFSGRSRRKEYWMWVLFVVLATFVLSILDSILGLGGYAEAGAGALPPTATTGYSYGAILTGGVLTKIFMLATLVPGIAVAVRRLHDLDRSGWWILLPTLLYLFGVAFTMGALMTGNPVLGALGGLVMLGGFICAIILLAWYCSSGTVGPNRFGPDPLQDPTEDLAKTFE